MRCAERWQLASGTIHLCELEYGHEGPHKADVAEKIWAEWWNDERRGYVIGWPGGGGGSDLRVAKVGGGNATPITASCGGNGGGSPDHQ